MRNSGKEKNLRAENRTNRLNPQIHAKSVNRTEAHISERGAIFSTSNVNKLLSDFFFGFFS